MLIVFINKEGEIIITMYTHIDKDYTGIEEDRFTNLNIDHDKFKDHVSIHLLANHPTNSGYYRLLHGTGKGSAFYYDASTGLWKYRQVTRSAIYEGSPHDYQALEELGYYAYATN